MFLPLSEIWTSNSIIFIFTMGTQGHPIQCTKCFTVNSEDSEYCTRCGTPLEEMDETISYSPEYGVPTK